jgi:hypothetical protein
MRIIVQARANAQIGCRITPQPDVEPPLVTTRWPRPKLALMRLSRPNARCLDVCGSTLRLFAAMGAVTYRPLPDLADEDASPDCIALHACA